MGDFARYLAGHNSRSKQGNPEYEVDANGCWVWQRRIDRSTGYGKTNKGWAHREVYEREVGPIPAGLQLDHLCRNRRCVNPQHLEPVTRRENLLRGDGPAARNARKTHCNQGHPFDEENTRFHTLKDGSTQRMCRACQRDWVARRRAS